MINQKNQKLYMNVLYYLTSIGVGLNFLYMLFIHHSIDEYIYSSDFRLSVLILLIPYLLIFVNTKKDIDTIYHDHIKYLMIIINRYVFFVGIGFLISSFISSDYGQFIAYAITVIISIYAYYSLLDGKISFDKKEKMNKK